MLYILISQRARQFWIGQEEEGLREHKQQFVSRLTREKKILKCKKDLFKQILNAFSFKRFLGNTVKFNTPGVNFINVLRAAFTLVAPQCIRTQSSYQYLFTLLGSTFVKAVRRMLMKLSPGMQLKRSDHNTLLFFSLIKTHFSKTNFTS